MTARGPVALHRARSRGMARGSVFLGVLGLILSGILASCGSQGGGSSRETRVPGPVDVLYAGSLVRLMERDFGPSFNRATGVAFAGFGAGSSELANQIKGRVRVGDVFISASPKVDDTLEGSANGSWVTWVVDFASAPLVLGYEHGDRFAAALATMPWEGVITQPGFLVGRTDPVLDPKGKLTVEALQDTARVEHRPSLLALSTSTNNVFPEETLLGRLEAGQLDAGFFYSNEAKEAGLAVARLNPVVLAASYTVTVLAHAPHRAAAVSFVSYLLGPVGRRVLTADGLHVATHVRVTGRGLPPALRALMSS